MRRVRRNALWVSRRSYGRREGIVFFINRKATTVKKRKKKGFAVIFVCFQNCINFSLVNICQSITPFLLFGVASKSNKSPKIKNLKTKFFSVCLSSVCLLTIARESRALWWRIRIHLKLRFLLLFFLISQDIILKP